jgi:hypothetical protein
MGQVGDLASAARRWILVCTVFAAIAITYSQPRLAQWREYHQMADTRTVMGIPNALNVLSNVPFAIVGLLGLRAAFHARRSGFNRRPFVVFFTGVALTALGSGYYHMAPDDFRLVWDRLPMAMAFMGVLTAVISEFIDQRLAKRLLTPLVLTGAASVLYWYWSEVRGAGDLRFYGLVQFGSLAAIALTIVLYPRAASIWLAAALAAYGLSKICEIYDAPILSSTQVVSGHTLKHLFAAAGAACIIPFSRPLSSAPLEVAGQCVRVAPGGAAPRRAARRLP